MKQFVNGCRSYEEVVANFSWEIPEHFNLGVACADVHPRDREALTHIHDDGSTFSLTFGDVTDLSNRMANALRGLGLQAGDRVGVNLAQDPATAITHLGAFKANLMTVSLSSLFGPDALQFRIVDSGAKVLVTDSPGLVKLRDLVDDLPDVKTVLVLDGMTQASDRLGAIELRPFWESVSTASSEFTPRPTRADEPCLVLYTSGSSGPPKGVVHAHRIGWGQAPSRQMTYDGFPQPGDCVWTPADWAWTGGLMTCLIGAWIHGVRVVSAARRSAFDPEWALDLMSAQRVTAGYLPPTALRMMMACPRRSDLRARAMSCSGERWSTESLSEARETLGGAQLCNAYGQTEADSLSGCFPTAWETRAETAGRVYPGHDLRVMREDGSFAEPGTVGEAVLRIPDPSAMLRYLNNPAATEERLRDGWLHTGDLVRIDDDGYVHFVVRSDEMIKSSGYRIGPGEVEECLHGHAAVGTAVVVGAPDPMRGEIVKAYVQLREGARPSDELKASLQAFVKTNLGAYQYPRQIQFLEEFPLTTNGKIDRGALRREARGETRHAA